jgi:type II secretory pathway pseudopilin PulG
MRHTRPSSRGFTLLEILVVVGVIITLIALLIPAIGRVKLSAIKASATSLLGNLQQSLEAYHSQFGSYPPSTSSVAYGNMGVGRGPAMLAQGLMGYLPYGADGAGSNQGSYALVPPAGEPAYGFRTRNPQMGGDVKGPFIAQDPKSYRVNAAGTDEVFIDPWGNEVLYFRSNRALSTASAAAVTKIFDLAANNDSLFAADDCNKTYAGASLPDVTAAPAEFFKLITPAASNTYSGGGIITGADSYLLISAGPDGTYFTADDLVVAKP